MKKHLVLIILIAVFLILSAILIVMVRTGRITNQAATNNATLTLSPASGNYTVGNNFPVDILINTGGQATYSTDVYLNYNTQDLEVIDADSGPAGIQIETKNLYPNTLKNSVNTSTGKITFIAGINTGESGFTGSGALARITFRPKQVAQPTQVTFVFNGVGVTDDSNVILWGTSDDILGSVTNGSYNLVHPDVPTTVNFKLEGHLANSSTTNTFFKVKKANSVLADPILFQKNDLTTDSNGTGTLTITGVPTGNYDFFIYVNHWLGKVLINRTLASPLTLNFGELKAGDVFPTATGDNQINGADFTYLKLALDTDPPDSLANINQDTVVNSADLSYIYRNWGQNGD